MRSQNKKHESQSAVIIKNEWKGSKDSLSTEREGADNGKNRFTTFVMHTLQSTYLFNYFKYFCNGKLQAKHIILTK